MNLRLRSLLLTSLLLAGWLPANGQADAKADVAMIVIEGAPFTDVIRNLATQVGQNYILDPRVTGQPVSIRWESVTAEQALNRLLKEQGCMMVQNPATTVARIVGTNLNVKPVPAEQIFGDTNKVTGLITFSHAPMEMVIRNLARQAGLEVELDPKLTGPTQNAEGKFVRPPQISVSARWMNISAAQALAAVLDNYDLVAVKDETTSKLRVASKATSNTAASSPATK